ncbi:hypothetical protein ZIOFF_075711 [Zingiber officinale]|uniref:Uncharacterized protein n=1 Tax=Zingiber officinale TaxID=94328 RepID=A0A8J5BSX1_ZINOF|nr:hypothetical protein ZIOFF_075707 [Zingiber officinale]KAG6466479.1 hypothetical protein ZIOFF_075711 [Zingiber officinale]
MNSEDMDLLEYTQLREWMRQWLSYLSWYYRVAMSPTVTIEELLDALVISFRPWVNRTEEDLVRFGYAWKCIDLICRLRKSSYSLKLTTAYLVDIVGYAKALDQKRKDNAHHTIPFGLRCVWVSEVDYLNEEIGELKPLISFMDKAQRVTRDSDLPSVGSDERGHPDGEGYSYESKPILHSLSIYSVAPLRLSAQLFAPGLSNQYPIVSLLSCP